MPTVSHDANYSKYESKIHLDEKMKQEKNHKKERVASPEKK
jgi:hypothetical protein